MRNFINKTHDNQIDMQWEHLKVKMTEVDKSKQNENKFDDAKLKSLLEEIDSKKAKKVN